MTIVSSFFVGYILTYFPKAGIFCMGMWIGIIISLSLNNVCLYFINSNPSNLALYIIMPIISVGFGIISICVKRTFIIFASCRNQFIQLSLGPTSVSEHSVGVWVLFLTNFWSVKSIILEYLQLSHGSSICTLWLFWSWQQVLLLFSTGYSRKKWNKTNNKPT